MNHKFYVQQESIRRQTFMFSPGLARCADVVESRKVLELLYRYLLWID